MAPTIDEEFEIESRETGELIERQDQLRAENQALIWRLMQIVSARGDLQTAIAAGNEFVALTEAQIVQRDALMEMMAQAEVALSQAQSNPAAYVTAMGELLEQLKRVKNYNKLAVQELEQMRARLLQLLDDSTPKA
jgi:hypothetical protein